MRKINFKEEKNVLLQILIEFNSFCKKNNIDIYLYGGTLLGAIRHQGFIPWDDDIDVALSRTDYNKLLSVVKKNNNMINSHLKVTEFSLNNSPYPFIKILDTNTVVIQKFNNKKTNLWIDVLPIDGINPSEANSIYKKVKFYRKILTLSLAKPGEGTTLFKKIMKPIPIFLAKFFGSKKCATKIDKIAKKNKFINSDHVACIAWGLYDTAEIMSKDDFISSTTVVFEKYHFLTISNYDSYLKNLYGNYMQLPPQEAQIPHHNYTTYIK